MSTPLSSQTYEQFQGCQLSGAQFEAIPYFKGFKQINNMFAESTLFPTMEKVFLPSH